MKDGLHKITKTMQKLYDRLIESFSKLSKDKKLQWYYFKKLNDICFFISFSVLLLYIAIYDVK